MNKYLLLSAALASKLAFSSEPVLHCEIYVAGETRIIETSPVSNPYTVKPADFDHFRFKAVFVGSDKQIEYVKLYSYYRSERQAVLIHQSKHTPPFPPSGSLSGVNYVYSPRLGREMQYNCSISGLN